ncbi:conjugal transfer protein [Streptomyces sp. TLI_171]|uniref:conjugal transfer protein n=1 Tax=Streptomyces sp. TLI_171 TaxID=1938859 RepID=UPI000C173BBF|nr:conjugal transfer protein [Streptomyces sp. TLI_171]RKE03027.1 conjugative transposon protein TcpC [Streptomyces sp. TLI_171]
MKRGHGRRSRAERRRDADLRAAELTDQVEDPEEDGAAGWKTSTATMAGAARLARIGVWAALLAGPLLGTAALLGGSSGASPARPTPAASVTAASGIGPAGFAQLYVQAYLAAGTGTENSLAPYYSGALALTNPPGSRSASTTVVMASTQVSPGYWSVTVAADVVARPKGGPATDTGLHYFQVGIQATGPTSAGGPQQATGAVGYTATALPAEVAAPSTLRPGSLAYGAFTLNSSDPAQSTVSGFLAAYLTGTGQLGPYTTPGVAMSPVSPVPYSSITVAGISDDDPRGSSGSTAVPADDTLRRVLTQVNATSGAGTFPLTYALTLRARAGRWEVYAVDPAPHLAVGGAATAPSPAADITQTPAAAPAATASPATP